MPFLVGVNDNFKNAVSRTMGFKTKSLEAAIKAVDAYQRLPNMIQFRGLKEALDKWAHDNPNEYNNRLSTIRTAFDAEMLQQSARWAPVAVVNNMTWVQQVAPALDAMKEFAVGDILAFRGNAKGDALQDCFARYLDFSSANPEPARARVGKPTVMLFGIAWNAGRLADWYDFTRYQVARDIRYTPGAGQNNPVLSPTGAGHTRATGCAICTEFAFSAAHVLTQGRAAGPGVPRVEVVSWSGGGMMAHVFVLVGRQVAPGARANQPLPPPAQWGADVVVVDTWLAALGHKSAYRLAAGDYPFPGFFNPVRIIMERA